MSYDDRAWDEEDFDQGPRRRRAPPRRSGGHPWLVGLLIGCGVLFLLCLGGGILGVRWLLRPTAFPPQTEDYAEARARFRTRLIRRGPAPQAWQREPLPPGVEEVEYVSGDLRLKAWVDRPAGGPARPAVLFLHGGFAFGADDWQQAQPYRDAGFVTMLPWLRGENGQPGAYSLFYDEVEDVLAAADVLARRPGVEPARLYVSGHSAGGTLALLAAMITPRFRAAASFSGSPDQVAWARGQMHLVPFDPADEREFQMRSPQAFARSFKCPARLYYGSAEVLFSGSSERTAQLAREAGLDVEAASVPGDHLTMVKPAMQRAIAFFREKQ
jgi:dienelactone hydrolase